MNRMQEQPTEATAEVVSASVARDRHRRANALAGGLMIASILAIATLGSPGLPAAYTSDAAAGSMSSTPPAAAAAFDPTVDPHRADPRTDGPHTEDLRTGPAPSGTAERD